MEEDGKENSLRVSSLSRKTRVERSLEPWRLAVFPKKRLPKEEIDSDEEIKQSCQWVVKQGLEPPMPLKPRLGLDNQLNQARHPRQRKTQTGVSKISTMHPTIGLSETEKRRMVEEYIREGSVQDVVSLLRQPVEHLDEFVVLLRRTALEIVCHSPTELFDTFVLRTVGLFAIAKDANVWINHIFPYMHPTEWFVCARVCKTLHGIVYDPSLLARVRVMVTNVDKMKFVLDSRKVRRPVFLVHPRYFKKNFESIKLVNDIGIEHIAYRKNIRDRIESMRRARFVTLDNVNPNKRDVVRHASKTMQKRIVEYVKVGFSASWRAVPKGIRAINPAGLFLESCKKGVSAMRISQKWSIMPNYFGQERYHSTLRVRIPKIIHIQILHLKNTRFARGSLQSLLARLPYLQVLILDRVSWNDVLHLPATLRYVEFRYCYANRIDTARQDLTSNSLRFDRCVNLKGIALLGRMFQWNRNRIAPQITLAQKRQLTTIFRPQMMIELNAFMAQHPRLRDVELFGWINSKRSGVMWRDQDYVAFKNANQMANLRFIVSPLVRNFSDEKRDPEGFHVSGTSNTRVVPSISCQQTAQWFEDMAGNPPNEWFMDDEWKSKGISQRDAILERKKSKFRAQTINGLRFLRINEYVRTPKERERLRIATRERDSWNREMSALSGLGLGLGWKWRNKEDCDSQSQSQSDQHTDSDSSSHSDREEEDTDDDDPYGDSYGDGRDDEKRAQESDTSIEEYESSYGNGMARENLNV